MAQTYTLDEAAQKLELSLEDFKRKIKGDWKTLKSFRDGPTLRFRAADIDELARSLGQASDPGLQPGDGAYPMGDSSDEIALDLPPPSSKPKRLAADKPLSLDDSSEDIFLLSSGDSGVSKKKPRNTGDSDVRLDMTPPRSDSAGKEPTEEIVLDLSGPRSGILKSPSSVRTKANKLKGPGSSKIPGPKDQPASDDSSSEFELSLDSDSDSFELQLNADSSEEVDLGAPPPASDGRTGQSGINLRKPADSGVSLENTPDADSDSDIDFELTLDAPSAASGRLGMPRSGGRKEEDSDSEFELSLDDNSGITDSLAADLESEDNKGDIFETDFELPIVADDDESGSEVVAIDSSDTDLENSDFDIAISDDDIPLEDDSASQVMLVDDEPELLDDGDAVPARSGKKRPGSADDVMLDDVETDEGASASSAMRRARRDQDDAPVRTVIAQPAAWGPLPALVLLPCLIIVLIGGLMSFEVVRGMWGYQQPNKPSDSLVRGVADTFGMKANE